MFSTSDNTLGSKMLSNCQKVNRLEVSTKTAGNKDEEKGCMTASNSHLSLIDSLSN
jgi:hypothetical protein